jgi:protocatechuate 3,4-dioxygenase beta subunit
MVEGRVLNTAGEPVEKADVLLNPAGSRTPGNQGSYAGRTDASGAFRIMGVAPGRYMLNANRVGYVNQSRSRQQRPLEVIVSPGATASGVEVKLIRQAVVTGRVTDEDGDPMQHANVQVLQSRYMRGRRQLVPAGGAQVNDLGEYRVANLAPGKYFVSVRGNRGMRPTRAASDEPEQGYVTQYYPGVFDPGQAVMLEVVAGQERAGVDFRMTRTSVYRIRGRVTNPGGDGKPPSNVMVMLLPGDSGMAGMAERMGGPVRGPDGTFEIGGVPPGSYTLAVFNMRGNDRFTARVPVNVTDSNVEGVVIGLAPAIEIAGQIRAEDEGIPLSGIHVTLEPDSMEGMGMSMFGGAGATKEDGNFTASNLNAGRFRVNIRNLPEGTYLKSVKLSGQESADGSLEIGPGAGPIELILGTKPGMLTGSVTDGDDQPLNLATVVLIPEPARRERTYLFRETRTQTDGRFSLANVAPGDYTLFAFTEVEDGAWFDPEFLRPFESKGLSVKISESSTQTVQITAN